MAVEVINTYPNSGGLLLSLALAHLLAKEGRHLNIVHFVRDERDVMLGDQAA